MSEHCPGCRNSDPTPQKVDPLGVMTKGHEYTRIVIDEAKEIPEEEFMNASHGTMSKTLEHIGLRQLKAMMQFQEFLRAKEKKP